MIKAKRDTMIFPNEGEWWGHFADGSQKEVLKVRVLAVSDQSFGLA